MCEQYEAYDRELLKCDFLKRHRECLPFIGEGYDKTRLLLIGESHYVPKEEVLRAARRDFYDVSFEDLEEGRYKRWIDTRYVFEKRVYDKEGLKGFFSNPAAEIARIVYHTEDVSKNQKISAMHQYAFMNYFKRPAYDAGKTIKGLSERDLWYAYRITSHIIEVLQPGLIIFLSKKAYRAFLGSDQDGISQKYPMKCVSHPSSPWWNRKRKDGGCAKEDFYHYVDTCFQQLPEIQTACFQRAQNAADRDESRL